MYEILFKDIEELLPIKPPSIKALHRLGLFIVRDLMFYSPYAYNIIDISSDLANVQNGKLIQAVVTIGKIEKPGKGIKKIYAYNDTGAIILTFFNKMPAFILAKLRIGEKICISGKVNYFNGYYQITHPDFILTQDQAVSELEPVYHLTYGLTNRQLHNYILKTIKLVKAFLKTHLSLVKTQMNYANPLENEISYMKSLISEVEKIHLIGLNKTDQIEQIIMDAKQQLAYKELFANQTALAILRSQKQSNLGRRFAPTHLKQEVVEKLGFALTPAQNAAITEIEAEQNSSGQMMRLLQGDVGSGKTLVALLTMLNVVSVGAQSVLMAPTDLLSLQHFQFFSKALKDYDINISLLTGKTTNSEKKRIKLDLATGVIDIIIGTHALFQNDVEFHNLGYIVIDEQHRFGVKQRMELINKANHPDILVMTATPIPRSLALTIFGDMNTSLIREKPQNRLPIITSVLNIDKKPQLIDSLKSRISNGELIYWICPLVDSSESEEFKEKNCADAVSIHQELNLIFPGMVGILHGKMKSYAKDIVMEQFKNGEIKILVATTVIEVGIDVPQATLIIIENAEKFGLAQLHQLRGRVGRGNKQSYCLLLYDLTRSTQIARKRIEIMKESHDGFYIAEQDLLLRGGGEILGTKQSGEQEFFFADLVRDKNYLIKANKLAERTKINDFILFQSKIFGRERYDLAKSG
ncbi:MAG: ATP-dependent DNA helicase RecG [Rickettsiaceae bacterium]|nr:ATP-dependent DNA helicase RecG [Rickettsiaceae bacterium]